MRLRYEWQASRSALCALLSTGESSLSRPTRYALATATELRSLGLRVPAATRLLTRRSNARAALAPGLCAFASLPQADDAPARLEVRSATDESHGIVPCRRRSHRPRYSSCSFPPRLQKALSLAQHPTHLGRP